MVQRQQVYAWQTFGMQGAAPSTVNATRDDRNTAEGNKRKRQRDGDITSQLPSKRQHVFVDSSARNEADKYHVAASRAPIMINLIDDDDIPPSAPTIERVSPLKPDRQTSRLGGLQPVHYPRLPGIGTQDNPVDLDSLSTSGRHVQVNSPPNDMNSDAKKLVGTFTNTTSTLVSNHTTVAPGPPTADIVPIVEPTLDKEQAELVDLILSGRNVFYTGSAGTGKSTVLKAFVKRFQQLGKRVKILAPTGRAALDINGSTTWTYAGWTPDAHKKPLERLRAGAHGKHVHKRLTETDVLVVDEISMVENHHFQRLNYLMKEARGKETAFGGVQIIVTGDFCQLPPVKPFRHCIECGKETIVNKDETEYRCRDHGIYKDIDKWAFRSKAWEECDFAHINLTRIHRQSDRAFINILNKLRMGIRLVPTEVDLLLNHESQTRNAIQLFATRAEVHRVNEERFRALHSKERKFNCLDTLSLHESDRDDEKLKNKRFPAPDGSLLALKDHRFESQIRLKKGMLVVLLHNLDLNAGLVNGSQGVIQSWEDLDMKKLPRAANSREERDLILKSGGQLLQGDHAAIRQLELHKYANKMEDKVWPVVRFLNGVMRTIYAECTVNTLGDTEPHSLLSRTQIPLMAAWAITTHKSQGMTLNRVIVDLSKSFEQGQAYVALSRARTLDGLHVVSFPLSAQGTGNRQVKEFLQEKFNLDFSSQQS